jgi:hypothetical protein
MDRRRKSRRAPGEGSIWERPDTGKYQAGVVVGATPAGNPRRIRKSFDTKTAGAAWIAEQQAAHRRGMRHDATTTPPFRICSTSGSRMGRSAPAGPRTP